MKKLLLNAALLLATAAPAFGADGLAGDAALAGAGAPQVNNEVVAYTETEIAGAYAHVRQVLAGFLEEYQEGLDLYDFPELRHLVHNPNDTLRALTLLFRSDNSTNRTFAIESAQEIIIKSQPLMSGLLLQPSVMWLHAHGQTDFVVNTIVESRDIFNVRLLRDINREDAIRQAYENVLDDAENTVHTRVFAAERLLEFRDSNRTDIANRMMNITYFQLNVLPHIEIPRLVEVFGEGKALEICEAAMAPQRAKVLAHPYLANYGFQETEAAVQALKDRLKSRHSVAAWRYAATHQ